MELGPGSRQCRRHRPGQVVAAITGSVPQHRVDDDGGHGAAVDRAVRNARWNAHPGGLVLPQTDALQTLVLQHDQIDAASQHHQLIGLMAMAEQFRLGGGRHFGDHRFVADQGFPEKGPAGVFAGAGQDLNRTAQSHGFATTPETFAGL